MDESIAQITAALRQLHDEVEASESRPSASEICARLLAIESSIVALETRRKMEVSSRAEAAVPTKAKSTRSAKSSPKSPSED